MDDILETLYEKISGSDSVNDRLSLITAKKDLTHLIDKKCNEARIDELEKLTDEQMNSQDWERANPGYSVEMVEATKIYDRLAELTKGGNNE